MIGLAVGSNRRAGFCGPAMKRLPSGRQERPRIVEVVERNCFGRAPGSRSAGSEDLKRLDAGPRRIGVIFTEQSKCACRQPTSGWSDRNVLCADRPRL